MSYTVDVDWLSVQAIIRSELKKDYERFKDPAVTRNLFSIYPEEDAKEIKKLAEALKRVLSFYGEEV